MLKNHQINIDNVILTIILSLFSILFTMNIGFLLGSSIKNPVLYVFAILLSIIILKLFRIKLVEIFFCFLLAAISLIFSSFFYDLSNDGTWYHQNTIIALKNGWNPIYEKYTLLDAQLYVQHYAKGHEIISAAIYFLSNNIELGKSINLLIIFACLLFSYRLLGDYFPKKKAALYAVLITLNPVSITQIFTYYIDGFFYNTVVIIIIATILYIKSFNPKYAAILIMSLCIFGTLKFTSIPVIAVLFIVVLGYAFMENKIKNIVTFKNFSLTVIPILILSVHPYFTNIKDGKSIFYPAFDKNSNVLNVHLTKSIQEKNRITKLGISLFSKTGIPEKTIKSGLKIPYTFNISEVKKLSSPTIVLGGFGIFFSAIFINSIIILIACLFLKIKTKTASIILLILASFVFYSLIFPEPWLARILPQFYLIPILILLYYESSYTKIIWLSYLKHITLVCLVTNFVLFIMVSFFFNTLYSLKTHFMISELKKHDAVYCVQEFGYKSNLQRLQDNNIRYKLCNLDNEQEKNLIYFEPKNTKISTRVKAKINYNNQPKILNLLDQIFIKIQ